MLTLSVGNTTLCILFYSTRKTHSRMIGHFQAVGHMTSETHVEYSCSYAMVLHYIDHLTHKRPRLPSKSATWLQDDMKMRITSVKVLQDANKQRCVVIVTCHEVATTKINPLQLREPLRKTLLNMCQRALEHIRTALAKGAAMEAFDGRRQLLRQLRIEHAKASARRTRIIKHRLHLAIFRIDTHAQANRRIDCFGAIGQTLPLAKRIERKVTRTTGYLINLIIGVGW